MRGGWLAALWAVALPLAAVERAAPSSDPAAIDRFVQSAPLFLTGTSLAAIRDLGQLQSESVKKVADPYDPLRVDEYRSFVFDGLEIYGLVDARQEVWPLRISVSRAQWEVRDDLNVGAPAERILAVLGAPAEHTPDLLIYRGATEYLNFFVRDDKIEKIEFIYYAE